jgi:TRAP transporter TAXI family solute receptor
MEKTRGADCNDFILLLHGTKRILLLLLLGLALAAMTAAAAFSLDKDIIILGTATPGGGFPVYGAFFAETVNQAEPSLEVQTLNTKGSTENVPMLEAGKLDIALVQGEVVQAAFSDIGRKPSELKIITAMYSTAGLFVVKGSSHYRSIRDLTGKPVVFGARGSGLVVLARYVLEGMGLDIERDFKAIYLDRAGDGPIMLEDGRAVALWGGGIGWPRFTTVARAKDGARFIAPDAAEIKLILARYPFLKVMTVPSGSYPGQDSPIQSVGSWSFVLSRKTLSDDTAYRLARALHRSETALGQRLPQARETTMANTVKAAPRQDLIHPGVLRYLREIGLVK